MGSKGQLKRNKYKKLGIIAIALLCIFQLLLYANKDDEPTITTEHEEKLIVNLKQKVKEKATASIQGSWQDIHFDLLVTSPRGNPIYWNNINLSDSDFKASGNVHSYEKGTIYYKVKDNNLEYQYKAQPWYISLLKWLSLVTLLLSFLAVIMISQITIDGEVKTISLVLAITGITAVYWLLGNILLLPHDLTTTILSVGLLEINSLHYLLSFISVSAIVSPMSKVIPRLVTIPLIRGMIGSFIVSCLIYTICTYIKHTLSIDVSAAGLNLPIQYSSSGITLLGISSFLILFTFYISTTIHSALIYSLKQSSDYVKIISGVLISYGVYYLLEIQVPFLALLAFILSFILIMDIYTDQQKKTAVFHFLWMIICSGFLASVVFFYQIQTDVNKRLDTSKSLYFPIESIDSQYIGTIEQDFRKSNISSQLATLPYLSKLDKDDFTDYIKEAIGPNLDRFNISVECFFPDGNTIFREHFAQQTKLEGQIKKATKLADYIYYDATTGKYILRYFIDNSAYDSSALPLIITLKNKTLPTYKGQQYEYLILDNEALVSQSAVNQFSGTKSSLQNIEEHSIIKDFSVTAYRPAKDISVYTFQKLDGLLRPISLFSFIITLLGILLLVLSLLNRHYRFLPSDLNFSLEYKNSLKNKIQFTIIALTIFSFLLIGLMTIIYFKNVLEQRTKAEKEIIITSLLNDINSTLNISTDDEGMKSLLSAELNRLSYVHQKDLFLTSPNGKLIRSSSEKLDLLRVPYELVSEMKNGNTAYHLHKELTGTTDQVHYVPLRNKNDKIFTILGIPEGATMQKTNSLLDFLSTVLNVYIFLFLVAGAIAVAISNSITGPLASLSEKLKYFKLGKSQEQLVWQSDDEIGQLINNFNNLSAKLDESADIIAKTERDTAWREMAKQVAHEIKNPLTPMKLSIQHLQRMAQSDLPDMGDRIERISKTLLEQFNNLNNIANSFSNFATMPQASNEKLILNEVVESVHDLFRKREDINITLSEPINDLFVHADRNHIVRVLNNIVKNAIQAIPPSTIGYIDISLSQIDGNAVIKVSDNGVGIPDHMKQKVFTPNFTTKNSGTGLGLAISANMIEAFNGRIYFETEYGKGTDFYIEIPLMKLNENFGSSHVSLD